nr:PREDICTED: cytosolic carboxypeptidase 2-like [Latimeria chalumnae]|eukprot:XP_006004791.1 PREDICTED: cytosolic carboxypeptidase 2-like [Latimeria chalumnae]
MDSRTDLRNTDRESSDDSYLHLMLSLCVDTSKGEDLLTPMNIPRVEDGLSENEEEAPRVKPTDAGAVEQMASPGSHSLETRANIISWSQRPSPDPNLALEAKLLSRAKKSRLLSQAGDENKGDSESLEGKLGVILTARVHPGESQSSWIAKGILDFLISEDPTAKELRRRFIFKVIPMLNPDGVIVGNYRCSLAARDLNRNYRFPKKEVFPSVWHTKAMIEEFQNDHHILLYCDLHGHSQKPNAFMYGNSDLGSTGPFDADVFLGKRIFPWLLSKMVINNATTVV